MKTVGILYWPVLFCARLVAYFRSVSLLSGLLLVPVLALGQTFVQENNNTVPINTGSVSVTYVAPETAGNLNIVVVGWSDTSSSVLSVADDDNNTYVLAGTTAGHGLSQAIYYAKDIVLPNNTTPTVTVTFNQNAGFPDVRILEYSGLSTTAPLDNWTGDSGLSTSADSGATTTSSSDLILGAGTTGNGFTGPGAGFTLRVITTGFGDIVEDMNGSQPAGSYNATAPLSNGTWVMQVAGFSTTPLIFPNASYHLAHDADNSSLRIGRGRDHGHHQWHELSTGRSGVVRNGSGRNFRGELHRVWRHHNQLLDPGQCGWRGGRHSGQCGRAVEFREFGLHLPECHTNDHHGRTHNGRNQWGHRDHSDGH